MTARKTKIIAISGGTCSGKSTFAQQAPDSVVVSTDDYYFDFSDVPAQADGTFNWEHPSAADLPACVAACQALASGDVVDIPIYEVLTSSRTGYRRVKPPASGIIIIEGLFAFEQQIASIADVLIFLDVSMNVRRNRRLERDLLAGVALGLILKNLSNAEAAESAQLDIFRKQAHIVLTESQMSSYWTNPMSAERADLLTAQSSPLSLDRR